MEHRDGNAIVYCEGAYNTTNGKTAHGLVRFTRRYRVVAVVDSRHAGADAGDVLDAKANGIPIVANIAAAAEHARMSGNPATHLVVGLAPDGGRLSPDAREQLRQAIRMGLNVDCGLHDYLTDDPALVELAQAHGVQLRDIRKPPPLAALHFFSGKIEAVQSVKIALLGTDSAVGKRTTAWKLVDGLQAAGRSTEMVGTGQTAWMQGARYGLILDSLINDYVAGEIEFAVWRAWDENRPDFIVIEGQGSLLNPAYPGGFEILAAGRPDLIVLQHAPARKDYDGFPGYPLHGLPHQIEAIRVISGKPVVAIAVNHEELARERVPEVCREIEAQTGLPATDVLLEGPEKLTNAVLAAERKLRKTRS